MNAEAWRNVIDRLVFRTEAGSLAWHRGGAGAAVASTPRGSFVLRYSGSLGATVRPTLEVRDADGRVVDRLEVPHPLEKFSGAITGLGQHPVLDEPTELELRELMPKLEQLVEAIRSSGQRGESVALEILGDL